jgi:hypothetical protein
MELLTQSQREQLLENGRAQRAAQAAGDEHDFIPVGDKSGDADFDAVAGPEGRRAKGEGQGRPE